MSNYLSEDERRRTFAIQQAKELWQSGYEKDFWTVVDRIYTYLSNSSKDPF